MVGPSGEDKPGAMIKSSGYCYSDHASSSGDPNIHQTHIVSPLQSFEFNPEIYNLTAGMDIIGFPSKTMNHQQITENNSVLANRSFLVEDPASLRPCVFPCDGNQMSSQGLSLSLTSSNPSLKSSELIRQNHDPRFAPSTSQSVNIQRSMQGQFHQITNSKYLLPAQELLNEFCSLGRNQTDDMISKMKARKSGDNNSNFKLQSLDILELQKRKSKLLQMIEEIDRRYKHYCNQLKAVASSFEAVAGNGAAAVYSATASMAMSRHFRCLRDGIVSQIKVMKKRMEQNDTAVSGTTKGETPRLKLIDKKLRQKGTPQQMSFMETHPWRPQRGLPVRSVSVLRAWLFEHFLHPILNFLDVGFDSVASSIYRYPSDIDKHILARQTGLSRSQVSNWFINARVRLWKPMVEEMYLEDLKEGEDAANPDENNQNPSLRVDQKSTQDQLMIRMDSDGLSSIINNPGKNNKAIQNGYDAMQFDYILHSEPGVATMSYLHENAAPNNYGGSGGCGVSLTLGLQQHGESGGVSLAFSPASQSSLLYQGNQLEDCQTVQYNSLFHSENQNLQTGI